MTDDPMVLIDRWEQWIDRLARLCAGEDLASNEFPRIEEAAELVDELRRCLRDRQEAADIAQLGPPTSRLPGAKTAQCAPTQNSQ